MATLRVSINMGNLDRLFDAMYRFQFEGLGDVVEKSAGELSDNLKKNVLSGRDAAGRSYPLISGATLDMEIKREGDFADQRIRRDVSTNPRAMNVTGKSAAAINVERKTYRDFNVGFDDARADVVFESNARDSGNSPKPKRDPLGLSMNAPSQMEIDIVEKKVVQELDRILNGF